MSRSLLTALTLIAITPSWAVHELRAQDSEITPVEQARFLLRALQFDRSFESRGAVRIAVLYVDDPAEVEAIQWAFGEMGAEVSRMEVSAVSVRFESTGSLLETVAEEGITAVYIPESLANALSSIQQVTRSQRIPSMSGGRLLVERGVALGLFLADGSRRIVVNLRSSKVEGMDLSAELLNLAEVIR